MPTSSRFNPFVTCGPTSNIGQTNLFGSQQAPTNQKTSSNSSRQTNQFGNPLVANPTAGGGYNLMSFGMPQYENFGFNPGMPNFSYGWNGGFPYTPYPILGYQPNNMMQYSILGNTFRFGGLFATPFPNNRTSCMPNPNNNYRGISNTSNNSNNNNNNNVGSGSNNSSHNGNSGNNNGGNPNGSSASNGPSVFQFPDTSLQHLKYEGCRMEFFFAGFVLLDVAQGSSSQIGSPVDLYCHGKASNQY
eukprot:Gb_17846 [translate_table: standard]